MEIVSIGRKKEEKAASSEKTGALAITTAAAEAVRLKGQAEYKKVMVALNILVNAMRGTVLFKDLANPVGSQLKDAFDTRAAMIDPAMSKNESMSPKVAVQLREAQRKLFLEYRETYHLRGIERQQEKGD